MTPPSSSPITIPDAAESRVDHSKIKVSFVAYDGSVLRSVFLNTIPHPTALFNHALMALGLAKGDLEGAVLDVVINGNDISSVKVMEEQADWDLLIKKVEASWRREVKRSGWVTAFELQVKKYR